MEQFQGRAEEIYGLSQLLLNENESTKVICITGEAGMGKTSLVRELFYKTDEQPHKDRFDKKLPLMAVYMRDWEQVITKLARDVFGELPPKVEYRKLEADILEFIAKNRILILLDSVDQIHTAEIEEFIRKWSVKNHKSMLLLTIKNSPFKGEIPENCTVYELKGLTEKFVIKNLLGDDLVSLIGEENVNEVSKKLNNNPQKLLYLRWRSPTDRESIQTCIRDLKRGMLGPDAVETVLRKSPYPVIHFLALARIQEPVFDETLLAFLWDRLGGGYTEIYVRAREYLLSEKLLSLEKTDDRRKFRLSAGVHMGLEKPLQHIERSQVRNIDYFISQYYRNLFTNSMNDSFQLHLLEHYVYHAVISGNFGSAYSYVFESDILNIAHNRGLSLELEPILNHFNKHLQELLQSNILNPPSEETLAEREAMIKIELGRVHDDLSRHESCLECMIEASKILENPAAQNIAENIRHKLKARIWYFSAISSSDLGHSIDCLDFYLQIVKDAVERDEFTWFDAVSMGYLSHELMFHDIEKSETLGKKALELSHKIKHQDTIIKNMCSLGQTLFFMDKKEESEKIFTIAHDLCSKNTNYNILDLREMGRILIHLAMVHISTGRWGKAENYLKQGFDLNDKFGDRRRAAIADSYFAITLYKQGEQEEGKEKMLTAVRQHMEINDWRNLVIEVMSYIWMMDSGFEGDLLQVINTKNFPLEIERCMKHILEDEKLCTFVDFWKHRFKPILLGS
jgi:tetratricopeptide (TPR) repeat protein